MAALDEGLRWVEVRLGELVDGAPPDAVQLRRKDGPRSWPVHALIKHDGNAEDTEARVRAETQMAETHRRLEEERRLAYVAITRARLDAGRLAVAEEIRAPFRLVVHLLKSHWKSYARI